MRAYQKKLPEAAALVSRLIARRAHSFRVQPCFMYLRKMNVALCRLKELHITENCAEMQKAIEIAKTAHKIDDAYYFPVKENVENLLVELKSYTKLLVRICMCAFEAHKNYLDLIRRSAFLEVLSLHMAVTANIWTICRDLCKSAVQFYNTFHPYFTEIYGASDSYPPSLDDWIGCDYKAFVDVNMGENSTMASKDLFLFDGNSTTTETKPIEQKFEPKLLIQRKIREKTMEKDDDDQPKKKKPKFSTRNLLEERTFKEGVKPTESPTEQTRATITMSQSNKWSTQSNFDLGEKISRLSVPGAGALGEKISRSSEPEVVKHIDVEQIKSIKEIREFLSTEDQLRNRKKAKNTLGIADNDWVRFTTTTNQILILGHHGLVMRKFKQSWQHLMRKAKK